MNSIDCMALTLGPMSRVRASTIAGVSQHPAHALRQLVGEVDAQVAADDLVVGHAGLRRPETLDGAPLAAADAHGLVPQRLNLCDRQCVLEDDVAVALELGGLGHGRSVGAGRPG
jgi:hypothetical protein